MRDSLMLLGSRSINQASYGAPHPAVVEGKKLNDAGSHMKAGVNLVVLPSAWFLTASMLSLLSFTKTQYGYQLEQQHV